MRMAEGVEWGVHCCVTLTWLDAEAPICTAHLAAQYEVPAAYLAKSLQALVRAGVLESTAGPRGGFRLARSPQAVTLLDIVAAVEGDERAFRCTEIRRNGPGAEAPESDFAKPCGIAAAMHRAEDAWRRELAAVTLAELADQAPRKAVAQAREFHAARRA